MGRLISLATIFASHLPTAFIVIEAYLINKLLDGFHQVLSNNEFSMFNFPQISDVVVYCSPVVWALVNVNGQHESKPL